MFSTPNGSEGTWKQTAADQCWSRHSIEGQIENQWIDFFVRIERDRFSVSGWELEEKIKLNMKPDTTVYSRLSSDVAPTRPIDTMWHHV